MTGDRAPIPVVAGVVSRGGRVLLCQRPAGEHLPLKWEFPGGKIEAGETAREALLRELREELEVEAEVGGLLAEARHAYPEKKVWLRFFDVRLRGEPRAVVHRRLRWVSIEELGEYDVPPPNAVVVRRLLRGDLHAAPD